MELNLTGKIAYVTGAATGIGAAVCAILIAEGMKVVAADIQKDDLEQHEAEFGRERYRAISVDLSTQEGTGEGAEAALSVFGASPSIVVNNVGAGKMLSFEEISDEQWHQTFELNLFAMVRTCRVLLPVMRVQGGGAIVNVASDLARQPEPLIVDYAASKAAILSVSKSMALANAPMVRVNTVCPGPIWTPFWYRSGGFLSAIERAYDAKSEEAVDRFIEDRAIPMQRMGTPDEVARLVAFLASDAAAFCTGGAYAVDGGTVRSLS